ncbi:HU family DNA-binding protein [Bacillus sonorensis]|uniref:HU family DNA-binding protein n=1 Tax=Bacillus sonorensis TaxID=119858 RepID=UPI000B4B2089|nr:HU family DNA-binding protein [Bacillus sonorensis]
MGAVAEATGLTKKDVELVVDSTFDVITSALKDGEKVKVHGFGSFEVRERAARKGRNPQSGEEIEIPATKAPAFKAAKALKDAIKQ